MLKLDVGCGSKPHGDVNVDFELAPSAHRSLDQKTVNDSSLKACEIPNLIMADAQALPFHNDLFDEVLSSHTIEHVISPALMLSELVRVSRDRVTVSCPWWLTDNRKLKVCHKHRFSKEKLAGMLQNAGCVIIESKYSAFRKYPFNHPFLPYLFQLPMEIIVSGRKIH